MPQGPYPAPHVLPTRIQAEDFDTGGEGVAYHDLESTNLGGAYRPVEGVDIETVDGITDVGWTRAGEYLEYSVNATEAGTFLLTLRAANPDAETKEVRVYLDGLPAGHVPVGSTGNWTTFGGFTMSAPFAVPAGGHVLTLAFEGVERTNLDWIELSVAAPTPTVTPTVSPTVNETPTPTASPTVNVTPTRTPTPGVVTVPGGAGVPTSTENDGLCDDVNGNNRPDFADVMLYFNQMIWIATNEPAVAFDYNGNNSIEFADVVWLFNHL